MYKPLRKSAIDEMSEVGNITITINEDWIGAMRNGSTWSSVPATINYTLGHQIEPVFTCYYSREGQTFQITNVEPTKVIADKKALVDAYLFVAIKGIIENSKAMKMTNLIFDSYIPSVLDHMIDLGFRVTPKGAFGSPGGRGSKMLKE